MRDVDALKRAVPAHLIIATYLEDGLREEGGEFVGLCPFHTERTPSFKVYTDGAGKSWFKCFGCAEHGDVVEFIKKIEGIEAGPALARLEEFATKFKDAGAEYAKKSDAVTRVFKDVSKEMKEEKRSYHIEAWKQFEKALENSSAAQSWLFIERGITMETARKLHFGYVQSVSGRLRDKEESARNSGWIAFPRIVGDKVVAVKFRSIAVKAFSQIADMQDPSALFNVASITPFDTIFVTEGEFDTAVLEQHGFAAVSIPNSSTAITPDMKKRLKQAECVILAGDNDGKVGTVAMQKLYRELEDNRYLLLWPGVKDANDYFIKTCKSDPEAFKEGLARLIETAKSTPIEGFVSLIERLRSAKAIDVANDPRRVHFPQVEVDRMNYNPPGSVYVIYSTYSGTGKSVFTSEHVLHEAQRGEVVVVFSPEIREDNYYALITAQVVGPHRPNGLNRAERIDPKDMSEAAKILTFNAEKDGHEFKLYVGWEIPFTESEDILKFIEDAIKVTGATRFIIDTFDKIISKKGRESETEAEGRTAAALEKIGIRTGCAIGVVAQANKQAEDIKNLNKNELGVLRGCRKLYDVAYGVYLLHRKRVKNSDGQADDLLDPLCEVHLKKDRGRGPGKAVVLLMYHKPYSRFVPFSGRVEGDEPRTYAKPPEPKKPKADDFTGATQKKLLDISKNDAYS